MRVLDHASSSRRHRATILSAIVAMVAAVLLPFGSPAVAATQPSGQPKPIPAYDHSKDKGKPGTRGPLSKEFSRSQLAVKFREDRDVTLRDGKPVARNSADTSAIQKVLAKYPGTTITRTQPKSETEVDAERARLESRTGRDLPDLNSWHEVDVVGDIEALLDDLNALPSVEIAFARLKKLTAPVDPLQSTQTYRTSASAGSGIDADFAAALPGGKGGNLRVTDVEAGGRESAARFFGAISAGHGHSLMLRPDGNVRAWGENANGQLGRGNTTSANVFMRVPGLSNVVQVAAGGNFSMALRGDGTVWAWGANTSGQLGIGTTTDSLTPVQVPGLSSVASIAAGDNFAVVVLWDGTMRAWGDNHAGQLGDGTTTMRTSPVTVSGVTGASTAARGLAAGGNHVLVVSTGGTVRAWGSNALGQLGRNPTTTPSSSTALSVSGPTNVAQVAAGGVSSYALLGSGAVWSWGGNGSGQLGNGSTANTFTPAAISGLGSVATVTAGGLSAAVTLTDHSVRGWGENSQGQLGIGTTTDVSVPTVVNLPPGANQVAAGLTHMLAVDYNPAEGNEPTFVWGWGNNGAGQLGTANTTSSTSPVQSVNLENLWNTCHEDLATRPLPAGPPVRLHPTTGSPCDIAGDHGTIATGFVAAESDNGLGINGLLPEARLQLVNASATGSVAIARANSLPGDVIWFEVAFAADDGRWWPWELAGDVYDEIVTATAQGIAVVEPAGNGGNSLDDPNDGLARVIMERPDSGAIMVGAGEAWSSMPWTAECNPTSAPPRSTMGFSTYGTRVDVQGWGHCITTTGVASLKDLTPSETDPNRVYWSNMNGTSGASPMVVGAAGAVQGIVKESGAPLAPLELRALLKRTGTPPPAGETRHIGPLPNIRAAIEDVQGGIAAGAGHTLATGADSTLWAWGGNANGQLGNGTTTSVTTPVRVPGMAPVRRGANTIAAGATHSLAVAKDGTVRAWGQNTNGQLGNGTTTSSSVPRPVSNLTNVVAVAAGTGYSAALRSDGTVWAWGLNTNGQLGDNTTTQRTTPVQVSSLGAVERISAGASHMLAVRSDGTLWAWGANGNGRLGLGDTTQRTVPTRVFSIPGLSTRPGAVAAGADHSVAVTADGLVATWGANANGQLGLGDTTQRLTPSIVSGVNVVGSVSAGTSFTIARNANGAAAGWGLNTSGQVGDNTTVQRLVPEPVDDAGSLLGVAAGGEHVVAIRADGTPWVWGGNGSGQLGKGTTTAAGPDDLTSINLVRSKSNVVAGAQHGIVADPSGRVLTWGANGSGQLGDLSSHTSPTPTPQQVRGVSDAATAPGGVAAGDAHSLAVVGDGVVLAWGSNSSGQLGNGTVTTLSGTPVVVSGLSGAVAVAAGANFSMALRSDGTVWTWGLNTNGQLGLGDLSSRSTPSQISGLTSVVAIAAGSTFGYAVRSDGTVRSWGQNTNGQLGDGTTTQRTSPVTVSGLTGVATWFGAVDGGTNHGVAAKADGTVVAWGSNNNGQLGANPATVTSSTTPLTVSGLTGVATVGAGSQYSLAVRADGTARSWGQNSGGQLGNGGTTNSFTPVTPSGSLVAIGTISGGSALSMAAQANGRVWSWGANALGQLGNGSTTNSMVPVAVSGT
jgi:alpha-tubulin suppressor-like RCC1 family protein